MTKNTERHGQQQLKRWKQGFTQFGATEEELSGRLGRVTRRKTAKIVKEAGRLSPSESKALYLEALQLLLRRQLWWLVRKQSFTGQIETVVRHLWDLRIRGFDRANHQNQTEAEAGIECFSSQHLSQVKDAAVGKTWSKAQSWHSGRGEHWPLPNPLDTLALCFLGSLLLRKPLLISELLRWSHGGILPFKTAFQDLPQEVQLLLPPRYANVLKKLLHGSVKGEQIHSTVSNLVVSFHMNYGIKFPAITDTPRLVKYVALLALPIEIVMVAKRLATLLDCHWEYPVDKARWQPLDSPEVLLVALVVVATKLCFPFNLGDQTVQCLPLFKWHYWRENTDQDAKQHRDTSIQQSRFDHITPSRVVNMRDAELEAFFAHAVTLAPMTTENGIAKLFPNVRNSTERSAKRSADLSDEETEAQTGHVLGLALTLPQEYDTKFSDMHLAGTGCQYPSFRTAQNLTESALVFYETVAEASGLPLEMVVRAVYTQEQRLLSLA